MAFHLPVLILLALLSCAQHALAAKPSCLACHPTHYEAVGSCALCHRGNDRTERKNLAHLDIIPGRLALWRISGNAATENGSRLLERYACRRCHISGATGNRLATNLDRVAGKHPRKILDSILKPVVFMPDFSLGDREAGELVNTVLANAERNKNDNSRAPQVVRFTETGTTQENVFSKRCGGCHRILTGTRGPLGKGSVGPNLSGLLTPYYPANYTNGDSWNAGRLGKWLANPRTVRPFALMQPVRMDKRELSELLAILENREGRTPDNGAQPSR